MFVWADATDQRGEGPHLYALSQDNRIRWKVQRDDYLFVNVDRLILINFFAYPIDLIIAIVILGASGCDDVNYSPIYQLAGDMISRVLSWSWGRRWIIGAPIVHEDL